MAETENRDISSSDIPGGGQYAHCRMCGTEFPQSKTKPRRTCDDRCRAALNRLKRRRGEPCRIPRLGTGTVEVTDSFIWFHFHPSIRRAPPEMITYADLDALRFNKNKQPRPTRQKGPRPFEADYRATNGGGGWEFRLFGGQKNEAVGYSPGFNSKVRIFGKRSKGGLHVRHKDYSSAINYTLASAVFGSKKSNLKPALPEKAEQQQ